MKFSPGGTMKKIHPFKLAIIERGLNQVDVADAIGVSHSRLNRILNGRSEPREEEEKNLREILGLNQEADTLGSNIQSNDLENQTKKAVLA